MFKKVQLEIYENVVLKQRQETNISTIGLNMKYQEVKNEYLGLINSFKENEKDIFIGGMPVQLEKDCMSQLLRTNDEGSFVYLLTLKVDGERFLLFLGSDQIVYLIDRSTNIFYFEDPNGNPFKVNGMPFLLDGELIEKDGLYEYLVFDVLFFSQGKNFYSWIQHNYNDRFFILYNGIKELTPAFNQNIIVSAKKWFPITDILKTNDIYKHIQTETNKERKKHLNADGLILQPTDGKYVTFRPWNEYNNVQFKWKPPKDLTIDFKIKEENSKWILLTQTEQVFMIDKPVNFRQDKLKKEQVPGMCLPTETQKEKYHDGDVVEFKIKETNNPMLNYFVPLRKRNEKSANSYQTAMSTMEVIRNPFYLDMLKPAFLYLTTGEGNPANILTIYPREKLILCACQNNYFTKKEITELEKIYSSYTERSSTPKSNFELEMRIFKTGKKNQGIDKFTYFYLLGFLKSKYKGEYAHTYDIILNKRSTETQRSTYDETGKYISSDTKSNIMNWINNTKNDLSFKISLSNEKESSKKIEIKTKEGQNTFYNLIRSKKRYSFNMGVWRIDITRVTQTYDINEVKNETFELELEYIGSKIPFADFIKSLNDIYVFILKSVTYC